MLCSFLDLLHHTGYLFLSSQLLLFPRWEGRGVLSWQHNAKGPLTNPWQLASTPVSCEVRCSHLLRLRESLSLEALLLLACGGMPGANSGFHESRLHSAFHWVNYDPISTKLASMANLTCFLWELAFLSWLCLGSLSPSVPFSLYCP